MTAPVLLVLRSFFPLRTQEHLHRHQHQIGCQISLVVTSGCGKRVVYGPKSDCNYFTEISKRLDNRFVKSYPIDPFCVNNVKAIIGHTTWTCTSNNFMLAFNALSKYLKKREFLLYLLKRCD